MSILLSLALLLIPIKAETGRFTIYQDGKKIGTEEFSIMPTGRGYIAEGRTQISAGPEPADLKSRMELNEGLRPTSYEYQSKGNIIRLKVADPLSELEYIVNGKSETQDVRFPADGVIIDNNFFHHYSLLLYRAALGASTVPALVPQELTIGQISVRSLGNRTYEFDTGNIKATATTDAEGRMIRLTVPDAKVVVER
jgi:hypothetical protein